MDWGINGCANEQFHSIWDSVWMSDYPETDILAALSLCSRYQRTFSYQYICIWPMQRISPISYYDTLNFRRSGISSFPVYDNMCCRLTYAVMHQNQTSYNVHYSAYYPAANISLTKYIKEIFNGIELLFSNHHIYIYIYMCVCIWYSEYGHIALDICKSYSAWTIKHGESKLS